MPYLLSPRPHPLCQYKPSQLPFLYTSKPTHLFTPFSPNNTFLPIRGLSIALSMNCSTRNGCECESSLTQQLSSSNKSMKLRQTVNCLLVSGCSRNLQGATVWLESGVLGTRFHQGAPLPLVGYIINSLPGRDCMAILVPDKETKAAADRECVPCCGPDLLSRATRLGLSKLSNRDSAAPSGKLLDVSRCRIL